MTDLTAIISSSFFKFFTINMGNCCSKPPYFLHVRIFELSKTTLIFLIGRASIAKYTTAERIKRCGVDFIYQFDNGDTVRETLPAVILKWLSKGADVRRWRGIEGDLAISHLYGNGGCGLARKMWKQAVDKFFKAGHDDYAPAFGKFVRDATDPNAVAN